MSRDLDIQARWDSDVGVATSADASGLVVEGDTWPTMIAEVRLVLPALMDLSGLAHEKLSLTFRAR